MGGTIPRLVVLGAIKKASSTSHEEQESKQYSFMASASAPASGFPPCWTSCPDHLRVEV